jgi:hypothetical protein
MNWERAKETLSATLDRIIDEAEAAQPTVQVQWFFSDPWSLPHVEVNFWYRPRLVERADLVLTFHSARRESLKNAAYARHLPDAPGREVVRAQIGRDTGEELWALDAVLLPDRENSPVYEQAFDEYVDRTCQFFQDHLQHILDSLREPHYVPLLRSRRHIDPATEAEGVHGEMDEAAYIRTVTAAMRASDSTPLDPAQKHPVRHGIRSATNRPG